KHGKLECFGLSLNLYGVFKIKDLTFVLLNPSNTDYWEEGMEAIDVTSLNYEEVKFEQSIIINIDDLQRVHFEYNDEDRGNRKSDPEWLEKKGDVKKATEYKNRKLVGRKELIHMPLKG